MEAIRLLLNALLHDKELPVKVEAGIAIQMFLNHQKNVVEYVEPQVSIRLLNAVLHGNNFTSKKKIEKIIIFLKIK